MAMSYYPGANDPEDLYSPSVDEIREAAASWRRAMRIPLYGSAIVKANPEHPDTPDATDQGGDR